MRSLRALPFAALALAAACLTGCGITVADYLPKTSGIIVNHVDIGPKTWAAYQRYLEAISPDGHGVFAIASDGQGGASWICKSATCKDDGQFAAKAIERCRASNRGYTCVVFDIDRVPQIKFTPPS